MLQATGSFIDIRQFSFHVPWNAGTRFMFRNMIFRCVPRLELTNEHAVPGVISEVSESDLLEIRQSL